MQWCKDLLPALECTDRLCQAWPSPPQLARQTRRAAVRSQPGDGALQREHCLLPAPSICSSLVESPELCSTATGWDFEPRASGRLKSSPCAAGWEWDLASHLPIPTCTKTLQFLHGLRASQPACSTTAGYVLGGTWLNSGAAGAPPAHGERC